MVAFGQPDILPAGSRADEDYTTVAERVITEARVLAERHIGAADALKTVLPGMVFCRALPGGKVTVTKGRTLEGPMTPFAIFYPEDVSNYPERCRASSSSSREGTSYSATRMRGPLGT